MKKQLISLFLANLIISIFISWVFSVAVTRGIGEELYKLQHPETQSFIQLSQEVSH